MAFEYSYSSGESSVNRKKILIVSAVVLVSVVAFLGINTMTGFVTTKNETEIKRLSSEFESLNQSKEQCSQELLTSIDKLAECEKRVGSGLPTLDECEKAKKELEDAVGSLKASAESSISAWAAEKENLTQSVGGYLELIEGLKSQFYLINSSFSALNSSVSEINTSLASCTTEKENLTIVVNVTTTSFREVVISSVGDICCRPGLDAINWNITASNRIVCIGPYTLDCRTGETNFP